MIQRGYLIDQLIHGDEPAPATEAIFNQLRADLRTIEGRRITSILNQLIVGYVHPMSRFTDPNASGALIALEACRNFIRELEVIAAYDDRSSSSPDPDPERGPSGRAERGRQNPGSRRKRAGTS